MPTTPSIQTFALVDVDCRLPPASLKAWAEAVTIASRRDFAQPQWGWGRSASVTVRPTVRDVHPGEVPIVLLRTPDVEGALGYHDPTRTVKIFPLLDTIANASVTISHEVYEWLGDEDCSTMVLGPDGKMRLREACDPVETDSYPVKTSSGAMVRVSNFVGIDYFSGAAEGAAKPALDQMGLLTSPGEIRPGGYQTFWSEADGYTQQTNGRRRAYRELLASLAANDVHHSRVSRRMISCVAPALVGRTR